MKISSFRLGLNIIMIVGSIILYQCGQDHGRSYNTARNTHGFKKEGEVHFLKVNSNQTLTKIDVEIANTPKERNQGLMYRDVMPDSMGMLFIFDNSIVRTFWMKNTPVALDILFVNDEKEIVKIHQNTQPYSEDPLNSDRTARYVIEVNAGFCEKYQILEGHRVKF